MKILRLFLALGLALALAGPAAAREWLRADTPNFIIYSDGYPLELERWARKLENFDALLHLRYAPASPATGSKLTVYMLDDGNAVAKLANQKYLNGIYKTTSEGSFAVTHRKPTYYNDELSGQMSLFHEYAHHFMYRYFPGAYPAWFSEGFAEYVATVAFDMDWRWTLGEPPGNREKWLSKDPLPIGTILFSKVSDFKPKDRSRFYAWSWLLVHMLNSDPERSAQLDLYLKRFGQGAAPQDAAKAFGDLDRLGQELRDYAGQPPRLVTSSRAIGIDPPVAITQLDELASQLLDLDLMRRAGGRIVEARDGLRRLAADHPDSAEVQYRLALAERDAARTQDETDFSSAEAAVKRALAIDPDHARANVLAAQLALQRLASTEVTMPADWDAARQKLATAIRLDPDDPLALATLFRSYVFERTPPTPMALAAIGKAFSLQPESIEIRLAYAFSLSVQGRHAEARQLVQTLASHPHSSGLGERALVTLDRMRGRDDAEELEQLSKEAGTVAAPAR